MSLAHLTLWLETQAKEWIKKGLSRLPVATLPNLGWSVSGALETGNTQKTVNMTCDLSQQMQTHTVQFDGLDNNVSATGCRVITTAEILWFVKGGKIRRVITVQDGASISGEAQSVDVKILDDSIGVPVTPLVYNVSATVAPGARR